MPQQDRDAAILDKQLQAFGAKYANEFRQNVLQLIHKDATEQEWFEMLQHLLTEPALKDLRRYAAGLRLAGFQITEDEFQALAEKTIRDVLFETNDVWFTWKSAPPAQLQAAGVPDRWSLDSLARNSSGLLESLMDTMRQRFGAEAFTAQTLTRAGTPGVLSDAVRAGLTGRRMWIARDPKGRHGAIDRQIAEPGEGWELPPRPLFGLPATTVLYPKQIMNTQRGRNENSGSKSRVLYGYWDEATQQEIFLGERGGRYTVEGDYIRPYKNPFPKPNTTDPFPAPRNPLTPPPGMPF